VEYLALNGCRPIVCTFKDGPLRQDIERLGIPVEKLPARRYKVVAFPLFLLDMVRILRSMAKLVKEYNVDVVQTHLLRSLDFLTLPLFYLTDVRAVLWTFQNASFELPVVGSRMRRWSAEIKNYSHRLLYRLSSHLVSSFVAVSDQVREAILEIIGPAQDKIVVMCNSVDVRRYVKPVDKVALRSQLGLGADARLIAVVATFKEQKGHRYLIEAMASVVEQHPEAHALLIGDGALRASSEAQVAASDLCDHVHFLRTRHDVPELLAASDLFVLPSLWEGLSMALLEAMATGLPVVATEVSGTVQAMIPDETGILVPPGDAGRLAQAIEQILDNPQLAQAMGAAARRRVEEQFSAQKQADDHVALYRRLLRQEVVRCRG
jgi:glycosyltransferase involved in cell wall biosynthesis